jgi:flagellar biogenesis protein FliO
VSALVGQLLLWGAALGLAGAGVAVLRARRGHPRGGDAIRLITSRYLGGKRFLTIVEVDGERLLLGLAGDQVSLVTRLGTRSHAEAA